MIRTLISTVLLITMNNAMTQTIHSSNKKNMTNKEKAAAVNKAVQKGDPGSIDQIVPEDYIQHTPPVPDGRKGLVGLIKKIADKELPAPVIKNIRVFEDGNFVVLHHDVQWPNRKVMIEIFRFENGMATEHWSAVQDHPEKTANGHSMVDGAVTV